MKVFLTRPYALLEKSVTIGKYFIHQKIIDIQLNNTNMGNYRIQSNTYIFTFQGSY